MYSKNPMYQIQFSSQNIVLWRSSVKTGWQERKTEIGEKKERGGKKQCYGACSHNNATSVAAAITDHGKGQRSCGKSPFLCDCQ